MKKTVTSDKTTGSTAEFKKTAAPESKAVATVVPKSVAKTKPAAVKNSVKASAVSILPEQVEVKGEPNLCQEKVAARAYLLWQASGYEHGRHEEHWLQAETLLKSELCP